MLQSSNRRFIRRVTRKRYHRVFSSPLKTLQMVIFNPEGIWKITSFALAGSIF
jgi:hypothetical protein